MDMQKSAIIVGMGAIHYIRDGRAPIPENEATSRVMSANKGRDTSIELRLRSALWRTGIRGYRVSPKGIPGRPDIVFTKRKVAIFVHGCFWHACQKCALPKPKTHTKFWVEKFTRNRLRDARKVAQLEEDGWNVMVVWEHEINFQLSDIAKRVLVKLA